MGTSFDSMFPTAGGRFAMTAVEGEPLADFNYAYGDELPAQEKEFIHKRVHDLRADMHRRGIAHQDMHSGNIYVDAMENEDGQQEVMDVNFLDFGLSTKDNLRAFMEALGGTGERYGDHQLDYSHYNKLPGYMQSQFDMNRLDVEQMMRDKYASDMGDDDDLDEFSFDDLMRGGIRIPEEDLISLADQFSFLGDDDFLEQVIDTLYQGFGTDLSKYQDS